MAGDASDVAFYYNQDWQLLEERKLGLNGSEDPDPLAQYVWSPTYIDALAVRYWDGNADGDYLDANEGAQHYLRDANFNVTAVVNSDATVLERYNYTPYGEITYLEPDFDVASIQYSTIGNSHLYTGRERDAETGLQLNRQRYYASWLGSWVTRDPIGYVSGTNLYAYVGENAIKRLDPSGLAAKGGGWSDTLWEWWKNWWPTAADAVADEGNPVPLGTTSGGLDAGAGCTCIAAVKAKEKAYYDKFRDPKAREKDIDRAYHEWDDAKRKCEELRKKHE